MGGNVFPSLNHPLKRISYQDYERIKQYIFANPDASLEEKRAYARSTTYVLQNRYEENQILKLSAFNLQQSDTEIVDQYNTIVSDISKLTEGTLDQDTIESYESLEEQMVIKIFNLL